MFLLMSRGSAWTTDRLAPGRSGWRNARWLRALAGLAVLVMALVAPLSASANWPERQVKRPIA